MQLNRLSLATACALSVASFSHSSAAQNLSGGASGNRLEEVIVMAQRVEQNLQDVPISVTAISGDALDARQIDSFDQLQYVAPGVTFGAGINARQSSSTIRGIGTSLFNVGIEGSVAVAVDGVILGREGAGLFDLSDVERVEVLRGPQGTLFGKNASAGVISIATRNPTDEFEADLRASYGSDDEINLSASVSGPLSDGINGRFSAYSNTRDGFVTNINPAAAQRELNDREEYGLRGKLAFEVSDRLDVLVGVDYASRDQSSGAPTLRSPAVGGAGAGLLGTGFPAVGTFSALAGVNPGPENLQVASEGDFIADMESYGALVEANYQLADHDLVSLTAYREWKTFDNNDADLIGEPFLAINNADLEQSQFSQEFRLSSSDAGRLSYTLGAYYFQQDLDQANTQLGTAGLDLLGALPPGLLLGTDLATRVEETNAALFGQGSYALTEKLNVIAGLRLIYSDIEGSMVRTVTPGAVGPYAGQSTTAVPLTAQVDDTAVAWRFGLQYFMTEDLNVFATVSEGYKSAGLVTGLTVGATEPGGSNFPTVDPETSLQYEVGVRSTGWDGRLTANLTAFYTQVDDFQAQALIPTEEGLAVFSVQNAATVETYGFEGELTVLPADGLTLSVALAYTDATFDDFSGAPCYALQAVGPNACVDVTGDGGGNFQDLSGKDLSQSPDWVANALARYDFVVAGNFPMFAQVGMSYRDDFLSSNTNDPNTRVDSYTLVDAQIGIDFWDDRATLVVFGRNLLNEDFVESVFGQPLDTGGYSQFVTYESQQSFGARIALRF